MKRSLSHPPALRTIAWLTLLAAGWLTISGCGSVAFFTQTPVAPSELAPYALELEIRGEPVHDADGYEVTLAFDLRADGEFAYNAIVQEIVQETVYTRADRSEIRERLTLVEAFQIARVGVDERGKVCYRLLPFQRDRHYERGYLSLGPLIQRADVCRVVRYYPAFVRDADWTNLGFAHLPRNHDGSLVTNIPRNFNERHQRGYIIDGVVEAADRARGRFYSMRYRWQREQPGQKPVADFVFRRDQRPPDETAWVAQTINSSNRSAGAGE
ncbi:MAG: hypothetical protein HPKKFMNG_01941 [Planctomycetes bacterium]|nr:hypothetical protein [Planctomycetota bacterium]